MQSSIRISNLKGDSGGKYISDTTPTTGNFDAIQAVAASVAALVSSNITGDLSAVPIPAGAIIYGNYTSITLASGKVFAYTKA